MHSREVSIATPQAGTTSTAATKSNRHWSSHWNLIQWKRLNYLHRQTSLGEMGGCGQRNPQKLSEDEVEGIRNDLQQKQN